MQDKLNAAYARTQQLAADMQLSMTTAARNHIQKALQSAPNALGLRVGVKKSGCSGFGYLMDFAKEINDNDYVFEQDGVRLVCDEHSLPMLKGSELDYVVNGLSHQLKFNNPNVVDSCGCGESFTTTETNPSYA